MIFNIQDQELLVVLHLVMNLFLRILFHLCIPLSWFLYLTGLHGSSGKLTGSTSSLNKLSVQSSGNRRSQSSSLLDMGNMSASDLDVADRTKFDKVKQKCCVVILLTCVLELCSISFSIIKKKKAYFWTESVCIFKQIGTQLILWLFLSTSVQEFCSILAVSTSER